MKERELNKTPGNSPKESRKKSYITSAFLLVVPVLLIGIVIAFNWNKPGEAKVLQSPPPAENYLTGIHLRQDNDDSMAIQPIIIDQKRYEIIPLKDTIVTVVPRTGKQLNKVKLLPQEIVQVEASYEVNTSTVGNIMLHVNNHSTHDMDLVVIEVEYIDRKGSINKKETIYIKDIPALQEKKVNAPNGDALEAVRYKVALVSAVDSKLYLVSR